MKIVLTLLITIFSSIAVYSQSKISGYIFDSENFMPIESAEVFLTGNNNSVLYGTLTDKNGFFEIKSTKNHQKAILVCKFIGYTEYKLCVDIFDNQNLDTIFLTKKYTQLDEIVVKGKVDVRSADRMIIYPKPKVVETSSNAWDVIGKTRLPGTIINKTDKNISFGGKSVSIKIDGHEADYDELLSIKPDEVSQIEFIDRPGVRYAAEEIGAIINIKTTHKNDGVAVGVNSNWALNTMSTNNSLYAKYNKGNHQILLQYSNKFRNYQKVKNHTLLSMEIKGEKFSFEQRGEEYSPYEYLQQNIGIQYNYYKNGLLTNIKLSGLFYDNFKNTDNIQNVYVNDVFMCKSIYDPKNKYSKPWLDLYFEKKLDNNSKLICNIVPSCQFTDYEYDYKQFTYNGNLKDCYFYIVSGEKYSLIAESIYEKQIKKIKISSGLKLKTSTTNNKYQGSISQNYNAKYNDYYGYLQGQLNYGKFYFAFGVGTSLLNYEENEIKYSENLLRPIADFSYKISKQLNFSAKFEIQPQIPDMSMINSTKQVLNNYEVRIGNENLKPYSIKNFETEIVYQTDIFYSKISYEKDFAKNIFDNYAFIKSDSIICYTSAIYDKFQYNKFSIYFSIDIIPNIITATIHTQKTYYNYELDNTNYKLNSWQYGANLEYYVGDKWSFDFGFSKNPWRLYGMQQYFNIGFVNFKIDYKLNQNWQFSFTWYNPLINKVKSSSYKYNCNELYKSFQNDFYDTANSVMIALAWKFQSGKVYKTTQKRLNNQDSGDGIIK